MRRNGSRIVRGQIKGPTDFMLREFDLPLDAGAMGVNDDPVAPFDRPIELPDGELNDAPSIFR